MKIFFHGASVTQQGQSDAYIVKLKSLLNSDFEIISKGYGGCHFSEAGVLTLSHDLDSLTNVNVCILEWNTTVLSSFKIEDLLYVINNILRRNILPVFMILGRLETINNNRSSELAVIDICKKYTIPLLDFRGEITTSDLRDEVHTNEFGALKYAKLIETWLRKLNIDHQHGRISKNNIPIIDREINLYKNISCIAEAGKRICLSIKNISPSASITIEIIKGPNSGYINYDSKIIEIWDSYCFYRRPYFLKLKDFEFSHANKITDKQLIIEVMDRPVDYSTCRRPDFNFEGKINLEIINIYTTNCEFVRFVVE